MVIAAQCALLIIGKTIIFWGICIKFSISDIK